MAKSMGSPTLDFREARSGKRLDRRSGAKHPGRRLGGAGGVFAALVLMAGVLQVATSLPANALTNQTLFAAPAALGLGNCTSAANACTLLTAVTQANGDTGDTINLATGTYPTLTYAITSSQSWIGVAGTVISGGAPPVTVAASQTVSLSTLTIKNGTVGGIANSGNLTLTSVTLSGNTGAAAGGAIANASAASSLVLNGVTIGPGNSAGNGGGIDNKGTITTTGSASTITGNTALGDGGGVDNELGGNFSATGLIVTANHGTSGGGIANETGATALSLTGGTIGGASSSAGNVATGPGGGIANLVTNTNPTSLSGVTVQFNQSSNSGGGIYSTGTLMVTNGSIANNTATAPGGGLFTRAVATATPPLLTGVAISSNQTGAIGGGIVDMYGGLTMSGGSIIGNSTSTTGNDGGGVFIGAGAPANQDTFSGVAITGNVAHTNGGGIALEGTGGLVLNALGTTGTSVSSNIASTGGGGGLYLTSTTSATCNIAVIPPGGPAASVPSAANNTCVEPGTTINGNTATGSGESGGGISITTGTLQVTGTSALPTTISGNQANLDGGGINDADAAMSVVNTTVSSNQVNSVSGLGGGIYGGWGTAPYSIVYDSTLFNNAIPNSATAGMGLGAGLYNENGFTLANDTIDGNGGASFGGGIYNNDVNLAMTNLTFTANGTKTPVGGAAFYGNVTAGTTTTSLGSIFAGDQNFTTGGTQQDECQGAALPADLPTSLGYNLDAEHTCGFVSAGDQTGANTAALQPLASNGGPTQTIALGSTSTAINGDGIGNPSVCPTFDQRGSARNATTRSHCDIGAYDTGGSGGGLTPTTTTVSVSPTSVAPGASVTYTATVSGGATPTGSVSFTAGGTATCTATLSGGTGSCTATNAPVGTSEPVVGTYGGDGGHSGSSGSTTLTVTGTLAPTTTTVTVAPSSTTQGTSVTYSATVSGGATPTGTVNFTAAGAATCTATLSSGSGSCTASNAPVGTDSVVGTYVPDSTHSASSGSATLVVTGISSPTSTSVSVSPGSVAQGGSVTYSATVTGGTTNPTGTVSFTAGGTATCTATLSGGSGSCSASNAPVGTDSVVGSYTGDSTHAASAGTATLTVTAPPPPPPPPPAKPSGYDMVGNDGGVFVFPLGQSSGFFGSLPALGIHVNNIVGMVPTFNDQGYFLVGRDGGVFAFGNAGFVNSLPGIGVSVNNIVGIEPTLDGKGYFLVGSDGGVFAFGTAGFQNSLPGIGVHVNNIVGIAATPDDGGYWVLASTGQVYAFGDATNFGGPTGVNNATAIVPTPSGNGYWVVTASGAVFPFGAAVSFGSLPALGVTPAFPVIGIVPTNTGHGYWLIGADGGLFAFGDASFQGSLPGLGIHVNNIVGAVPTG